MPQRLIINPTLHARGRIAPPVVHWFIEGISTASFTIGPDDTVVSNLGRVHPSMRKEIDRIGVQIQDAFSALGNGSASKAISVLIDEGILVVRDYDDQPTDYEDYHD